MNPLHLDEMLSAYTGFYQIVANDRPIHSAEEGAAYFHIALGQTAPTLILDGDRGCLAAVVSGARKNLDLKALARTVGCRTLKLAHRGTVQRITGHAVGVIPMIGLDLPYVLDTALFAYDFVYGGTGVPDKTLKIAPAVLEKVTTVIAKI